MGNTVCSWSDRREKCIYEKFISLVWGKRPGKTGVYPADSGHAFHCIGSIWCETGRGVAGRKYPASDRIMQGTRVDFDVVESIPVTEEIKLGKPEREQHIQNYCESVRRCAKYGIKCITYNFMPVFDWTRTQLDKWQRTVQPVLLCTGSRWKDWTR